jgi:hypothetical protein
MFAPSRELAEEFAAASIAENAQKRHEIQDLLRKYIVKRFAPDADNVRQRVLLRFSGERMRSIKRAPYRHIVHERPRGETIRDTYGDYIVEDGRVIYFEPAALPPRMREQPASIWPSGPNTRTATVASWRNASHIRRETWKNVGLG